MASVTKQQANTNGSVRVMRKGVLNEVVSNEAHFNRIEFIRRLTAILERFGELRAEIKLAIGCRECHLLELELAKALERLNMSAFPVVCMSGTYSFGKSRLISRLVGLDLPTSMHPTTQTPLLIELVPQHELASSFQVGQIGRLDAKHLLHAIVSRLGADWSESERNRAESVVRSADRPSEVAGALSRVLVDLSRTLPQTEARRRAEIAAYCCRSIAEFVDEESATIRWRDVDLTVARELLARDTEELTSLGFNPDASRSVDKLAQLLDDIFFLTVTSSSDAEGLLQTQTATTCICVGA